MKKKSLFSLALVGLSMVSFSQTKPDLPQTVPAAPAPAKEYDFNFYGFVRTDYIWDTRKSVQVRENNLNLYPLDEAFDTNGEDVNATGQSNFLSITSRLGVKAKGPDVWGAKTTATLEGDFFGNTEASIGLFRLRHAHVNLDWKKTGLLFGQSWYPTFIPEVFPGVVDFNTGILFNPFGWVSQVKIKQNLTKELTFSLTAYKEREFTTATAIGGTQNSASINSALPTVHGQFQFRNKSIIAGLGAEFKSLQPLTVSNGKKSSETVNSTTLVGYFRYSNDKIIIKTYGITGGDMFSFVQLGGFAGYSVAGQPERYEASKTTSVWVDIASNGKSIAPGFFFGHTKNNGTGVDGATAFYMRGVSGNRVVDNVWRVSGRVDFKQNKFRLSPELELTKATWGNISSSGRADGVKNTDVSNIRAMLSAVYSF